MPALDREILAERAAAVERHLTRVAERLPARPEDLEPATDAWTCAGSTTRRRTARRTSGRSYAACETCSAEPPSP